MTAAVEPATGPGAPCAWCGDPIPQVGPSGRATRSDVETCRKACRQARWRHVNGVIGSPRSRRDASPRPGGTRRSSGDASLQARPIRVAYADPPYPGFAGLYADHPDYAGEVDHADLIRRLSIDYPDGWALSTSSKTLQTVLALCPPDVRIGAWTKPAMPTPAFYPYAAWEPVIFRGGRPIKRVGVPDYVQADPGSTHGRGPRDAPGQLVGIKPAGFCRFMFDGLGLRPGDELVDLYPGSGAVGRAWSTFTDRG